MKTPELLLPAGNEECLRAAVANGADAVYLGLGNFNARRSASNFDEKNIFSVIDYCHKRDVKVYVALNTLVKNNELNDYFRLISLACSAGADAVIIQDPCFIPIIKKNFPGLAVHLSTQATTTNTYSIPEGIERVILPRELSLDEIQAMSKKCQAEMFVHGALCFCYSGQCLFSSMSGGRSGNRGLCAQPCRKLYNKKYLMSTMDLCMLARIPELINAGVLSFKIEGRLRSPLYVATTARIYRKYIDMCCKGKKFSVDEKDIDDLKIAFSREFTQGFAFSGSVVDSRKPMNRGLFIGVMHKGILKLRKGLKIGDGIGFWMDDQVTGQRVEEISKQGVSVKEALPGDEVKIIKENMRSKLSMLENIPVYKTSSADMAVSFGDEIKDIRPKNDILRIELPKLSIVENKDNPKLFVKTYTLKSAIEADKAGADIIYYDILKEDCDKAKKNIKNAEFYVFTPRILSDQQAMDILSKIKSIRPEGVLVSNRGLYNTMKDSGFNMHLDYSFNCFNDIDMNCRKGIPIISPELSIKEIEAMKSKRFILITHGDIVLMTSKEKISAPEIIDEEGRRFKIRN
ncbi:MAG: U32 family peptidase, partial [Nanoarchaeota archaeon]|nr:U32 family peptidase [Nanoarchaeota archaeon]